MGKTRASSGVTTSTLLAWVGPPGVASGFGFSAGVPCGISIVRCPDRHSASKIEKVSMSLPSGATRMISSS